MLRGRRNEFRQPEDDIQFSDISTILLNSGNVFKPDASVPKGQKFLRCKRSKFSTRLTLSFGINKNMFKKIPHEFSKKIQFFKSSFHLDLGSLEKSLSSWFIYLKKKKIQPLPITALRYFLLGWI